MSCVKQWTWMAVCRWLFSCSPSHCVRDCFLVGKWAALSSKQNCLTAVTRTPTLYFERRVGGFNRLSELIFCVFSISILITLRHNRIVRRWILLSSVVPCFLLYSPSLDYRFRHNRVNENQLDRSLSFFSFEALIFWWILCSSSLSLLYNPEIG